MRWAWCFGLTALFTTAYAAPTDIPSAASFYVRSLPDLHQDESNPLHIYAGHISSDPDAAKAPAGDMTAHLYFVMVKARRVADKERVMFWFNGGPGCSSFDGLMMEVGPWRIDGDHGLKTVEGGWEEYTTMVYIDQPAGTGFSYTSTNQYIHGLEQSTDQFMTFLDNFYKVFPEYLYHDTYLGGESYAGQFIPYFADAMLKSSLNIPLGGIAIGNGWIDGKHQYPAYFDYAVKHGLIEEGSDLYKQAQKRTQACLADIASHTEGEPISTFRCEALLPLMLSNGDVEVDGQKMCTNIYDVRLQDTSPACGMNWPVDLVNITKYLGRSDVINALHAGDKKESWTECRGRVHQEFNDQISKPSILLFPGLLEKIPVLLFAGDQDFICNYLGIEALISDLTWNGEKGLGKVQTQSWSVDGAPAGTWVSSRNLTYVKLFNASHMAPYDVPHVAHDMILRFMGMNFSDVVGGSARIPSSVGDDVKPTYLQLDEAASAPAPTSTKTPEQDKAMWEAYYNAGSAALVLLLIAIAVGAFFWCRMRRRKTSAIGLGNSNDGDQEESIPLYAKHEQDEQEELSRRRVNGNGKGKERADVSREALGPPIFDVGEHSDEDDGEDYRSDDGGHHR